MIGAKKINFFMIFILVISIQFFFSCKKKGEESGAQNEAQTDPNAFSIVSTMHLIPEKTLHVVGKNFPWDPIVFLIDEEGNKIPLRLKYRALGIVDAEITNDIEPGNYKVRIEDAQGRFAEFPATIYKQ